MRAIAITIFLGFFLGACATQQKQTPQSQGAKEEVPDRQYEVIPRAQVQEKAGREETEEKRPPAEKRAPEKKAPAGEPRKRGLERAVALLEKGDTAAATKALRTLTKGPAVEGVTDEALFRLALLSLKPTPERGSSSQAEQLLRRLKKEYPKSPWTVQAAPLMELIKVTEQLRHQNLTLKASSQSAAAENDQLHKKIDELNKTLEQLKHVDQELEQKNR